MRNIRRGIVKIGVFLAALCCALLMTGIAVFADDPVLSKNEVTLRAHSAFVLHLKNAAGTVKWTNTNTKILGVVYQDTSRIVIHAKRAGSAKIKCAVNGVKLVCRVKVKAVKGIPKKMTVIEGDKITFRQDKKKKGIWSTSDETIAKINGKKKAASKKIRFLDVGTVKITEKIGKKKYTCQVTVLTKQGYKTRPAPQDASAGAIPSRAAQLIQNCYEIAKIVETDIAAGVHWEYWNSSSHRSELTFDETRAKGKTWTNCMGGVTFALRYHDLVGAEGVRWFATKGGIYWYYPYDKSEADARQYFETIPVFKKVEDAIKDGTVHPGDILTYRSMEHVNVYLGNMTSFDTGHAFCSGSGEGARYEKWIGETPYLGRTCAYIVRLKEVVGAPDTPSAPSQTETPTQEQSTQTQSSQTESTQTQTTL